MSILLYLQKIDLNVQTINVILDAEFIFHKHRCFVHDAMKYEMYIYLTRPNLPVIVGKYTKNRGYEGKMQKENCLNNF